MCCFTFSYEVLPLSAAFCHCKLLMGGGGVQHYLCSLSPVWERHTTEWHSWTFQGILENSRWMAFDSKLVETHSTKTEAEQLWKCTEDLAVMLHISQQHRVSSQRLILALEIWNNVYIKALVETTLKQKATCCRVNITRKLNQLETVLHQNPQRT